MAKLGASFNRVLFSFALRLTGTLLDWYVSFREYSQLEIFYSSSITVALARIYNEFLGQE